MKKILAVLFLCSACAPVWAQFSIRFVVNSIATKKQDDIYVTGSFNNWTPDDTKYKLKPFGPTRRVIVLKDMQPGKYEFKFTRGGLDKVETTAKGEDIDNRVVEVAGADVSVDVQIPGWKDDYPDKPKPFTATAQVHWLDSAFAIPQLNRTRRIWVYLPKSYNVTKGKSYPVLYMQDGENLFNEQTAANGEWGVDECLDSLQKITGKECIVVGIAGGAEKRINEYNPYDNAQYGKGEGKQYAEFLARTLKPFVDMHYRTVKDPAHTWVAGSSMGGVISLYAVMKYPDVFGVAGILSPALDTAVGLGADAQQTNWTSMPRFYFYTGGKEGNASVSAMDRLMDVIQKKNRYDTRRSFYPLGEHNEAAWRKEFPAFYRWLVQ
ncbi:alpha/beta hydrolase-fold protein [Deminuibacter soli]|nr:alpha/beta hydrolase-fold protein [Deminuibacter soli]